MGFSFSENGLNVKGLRTPIALGLKIQVVGSIQLMRRWEDI